VRDEARLSQHMDKLVNALAGVRSPPFPFDRVNGLPLDGWNGHDPHHGWTRLVQTIEAMTVRAGAAQPGQIVGALRQREQEFRDKLDALRQAQEAFQDAQSLEAEAAEAAKAASATQHVAEEQLRSIVDIGATPALRRAAQQEFDGAVAAAEETSRAHRAAKTQLSQASRRVAKMKGELERLSPAWTEASGAAPEASQSDEQSAVDDLSLGEPEIETPDAAPEDNTAEEEAPEPEAIAIPEDDPIARQDDLPEDQEGQISEAMTGGIAPSEALSPDSVVSGSPAGRTTAPKPKPSFPAGLKALYWIAALGGMVLLGLVLVVAIAPHKSSQSATNEATPTNEASSAASDAAAPGVAAFKAGDYSQALQLLSPLAATGNDVAEYYLGLMNQHGLSMPVDYVQAMSWYQKSAAQGNGDALNSVGWLYDNGWGVANDYGQAMIWYQKAADLGNASAENNIGYLYQNGLGVTQDYGQAMSWYEKAAAQGNPDAQSNVGHLYESGLGVPKDYGQAMVWYQKAAAQGNATAQNNIGWLYDNGWGVALDYSQAMSWYQKAADQGNASAENNIAYLYANGLGVAKDLSQARAWYTKAAAAGSSDAQSWLRENPQ